MDSILKEAKRSTDDLEMRTYYVGELIQHDSSCHYNLVTRQQNIGILIRAFEISILHMVPDYPRKNYALTQCALCSCLVGP